MTTDNEEYQINSHTQKDHTCSFCGKPPDQVQRLIAGPESIHICNECIDLCQEILDEERVASLPRSDQNTTSQPETPNPNATPPSCSFCGKTQDQVQRLVAGLGNHYICDECIDLRRKNLEDQYITSSTNPAQNTSSPPETSNSNAPTQKTYKCSFCGKTPEQVQYLIAGPGNHYICNECIDQRRKAIEDQYAASLLHSDQDTSAQPETPNSNAPAKKIYSCSFCGKTQDQVQRLIAGPEGFYICDECVGLCQEVMREDKA